MGRATARHNAASLFGVQEVPSDNRIRTMLDAVPPESLYSMFDAVVEQLIENGTLEEFRSIGNDLLVTLDGTEYYHVRIVFRRKHFVYGRRAAGKEVVELDHRLGVQVTVDFGALIHGNEVRIVSACNQQIVELAPVTRGFHDFQRVPVRAVISWAIGLSGQFGQPSNGHRKLKVYGSSGPSGPTSSVSLVSD